MINRNVPSIFRLGAIYVHQAKMRRAMTEFLLSLQNLNNVLKLYKKINDNKYKTTSKNIKKRDICYNGIF